jgi:positive regulator of sigma E activity
MLKKVFESSIIYFILSGLFAIAAIAKTVSNDPAVLAFLWICVVIFGVLGILRFRKKPVQ